jgi:iron complex transport system ATP-binding protein
MIEINNFSFGYKNKTVLSNIGMTAVEGEITAIIGANGTGKSTLLKNICGLLRGRGEILINGRHLNKYKRNELSSAMSYLPQDTYSSALLSVFEVVLLGNIARLGAKVSDEDMEIVRKALSRFDLEKLASRNIGEISGGQRQLVFIAQALARNPAALIMDEPTSNLDMFYQFKIMNIIKDLTRKEGYTTVVTLHQLDVAARFADKIIVLNEGKVYACGQPREIITTQTLRDVYRMDAEVFEHKGIPYPLSTGTYGGREINILPASKRPE